MFTKRRVSDKYHLLRNLKTTWTDFFIVLVTRFMSNEKFYTDCLEDLKDQNLGHNEKELLQKKYLQRRQIINEMADLSTNGMTSLPQQEMKYKEIVSNAGFESSNYFAGICQFSNAIYKMKKAIDEKSDAYQAIKVANKDIHFLKLLYHYSSALSRLEPEAFNAQTLIDKLISLKLTDNISKTTLALIKLYQTINGIAAIKEKILSKWENPIKPETYKKFKMQIDMAEPANQSLIIFENNKIVFNNKPNTEERRNFLLKEYLEVHLPLGNQLLAEFRSLIQEQLINQIEFLNQEDEIFIENCLLDLKKIEILYAEELQVVQTISVNQYTLGNAINKFN